MNEFVEQFLLECRDLVAQATDDLLALEEQPQDRDRLDSAFRAFHTLKGAAGIVEFEAMGRALHAAEDVLASARAGTEPVTPQLVGDGLTCLDQLVQWLDAMQVDGEIPAGADAQADAIVRRFARAVEAPVAPATADPPAGDWPAALSARHPQVGAAAALRYTPDADSFFRGEDPLARLADLPGLVALDIASGAPWPRLEDFDPFACRLAFEALFSVGADELSARVAALGSQVEVRGLPRGGGSDLPPAALALLAAQARMLADPAAEPGPGRAASARRVVANVLRALGRPGEADRIERAELDGFAAALDNLLAGGAVDLPDAGAEARAPQEAAARALRVEVERIDALVNLTGELTVAKNALAHAAELAASGDDPDALAGLLKAQHLQLDRLVGELQRSVLHIRVLPLRHVFQRFPRLVREMVGALGKPAHLVTEGDATEADKAVVETLFEPLLHILRNAMDHGVESPDERKRAGKPPAATLRLRALRQGDQVVIEVEDDGRGIDVARVRRTAEARGLVAPDRLAEMPDEAVVDLIFAPGFSTAAEVTSLSGRGVGMDAVRTSIERLGGRVHLDSRAGEGTTVRLTLPFTVMMSRVMTVEAGGQLFGIPLEAVVETVRLPRERIRPVGGARAFVLRQRTIPLIDLAEALGEAADDRAGDAQVVVAMAGGQVGGLEVDRLGERMDVMLKPMEGLLSGMPGIAGTTLLGDGRVLLVLDLQELLG